MNCINKNTAQYKEALKAIGDDDITYRYMVMYDGKIPNSILKGNISAYKPKKKKTGRPVVSFERSTQIANREALQELQSKIDFKKEDHIYKIDGKIFNSTTTTIDMIDEYAYTGTKKEDYEVNSDLGSKMHSVVEGIIKGVDKEKMDNSFTTPELFDQFYEQIYSLIDKIKEDGEILSEVRVANTKNGIAGSIDIAVLRHDGMVDIYDLKTSINPTSEKALYRNKYQGKASKEEKHGLQLATYGRMLELGDEKLGIPSMRINNLTIIPVNIKIEKDQVASMKFEPLIPLSYARFSEQTKYTLPNQPLLQEEKLINKEEEMFYKSEHKELESWAQARYESYNKVEAQKKLEEINKQLDDIEFDDKMTDKEKVEKMKPLKEKKQKLLNRRQRLQEEFDQYRQQFREIVDFYLQNDVAKLTDIEYIRKVLLSWDSFDPEAKKMSRLLQIHLNSLNIEAQKEKIREEHPDYDYDYSDTKDLNKIDPYFKSISDFTEEFPEMQIFANHYLKATTAMNTEKQIMLQKLEAAGKAVIKEYNKKNNLGDKVLDFANPVVSNEKYFSFMENNGKAVTISSAHYKTLTPAQQEFVSVINSLHNQYERQITANNGNVKKDTLIKVQRTFAEDWRNDGLLMAFANYIGSDNYKQRSVLIKYNGNDVSYGDVESYIKQGMKSGRISKIAGLVELKKAKKKAIKQIESKKNSDGTKFTGNDRSEFELNAHGELTSRFQHANRQKAGYSKDYYRAYMEMFTEMNFIKHMQPIIPEIEALEAYNKSMGNDRTNMIKYLEVFKKGNILKEDLTVFGRDIDKWVKFFRKLTHLRVMAFNIPAATFNVLIGKYTQWRGQEYGKAAGEKRYWGEFKKTQAILTNYQGLSTEYDFSPRDHIGNFFNMLMFGATKAGENYIQGSSIVGQFTDEEWSLFDENGKVIGKENEEKILRAIEKYKKRTRDLQGKYSDEDKRGFSHFELGRAIMQFKVWMPDAINDRFKKKYIDMYGNVRQGTLSFLVSNGGRDMLEAIRQKDFWTSKDPNVVLARRNVRSFIAFASTIALYAAVQGDDDDDDDMKILSMFLERSISDMSVGLSFDGVEATLKKPFPFVSTMESAVSAVEAIVFLQENRKGELKAPKAIGTLMPYNNIVRQPIKFAETFLEDSE